jgi:hypothetical protein
MTEIQSTIAAYPAYFSPPPPTTFMRVDLNGGIGCDYYYGCIYDPANGDVVLYEDRSTHPFLLFDRSFIREGAQFQIFAIRYTSTEEKELVAALYGPSGQLLNGSLSLMPVDSSTY